MVDCQLFRNDFDENAVREDSTTEQVNGSVASKATQHGLAGNRWDCAFGGFISDAAGWNCGSGTDPGRRRLNTLGRGFLALGTAVHCVVRKLIGCFVLVSQSMTDFEPIELCDAAPRLLPKGTQIGRIHLVFALDLFHHELGIGDHTQAAVAVIEYPLQAAEQAGVFGVVVGAIAKKLG